MKTEGDVAATSPETRRYTTEAQEVSSLEQYYNKISLHEPAHNTESVNASPTPIGSHKRNSTNDYHRNQTVLRRNLEPIQPK